MTYHATDTDQFDLVRFVNAQALSYDEALREIQGGKKQGHWMWFVFPQLAGLGRSETAQRFAIGSLDEACAYLAHPLLGPRYRRLVAALLEIDRTDAESVFGATDAWKLRSSLTLFAMVSEDPSIGAALHRWFNGPDHKTLYLAR